LVLDLSSVIAFLSSVSSIAVIAGAVFIVFQLRQNAKLIEATIFENKSNIGFSVLEKITDESFARRRKEMYEAVKKYAGNNWKDFDDSLDDFQVRNFAYVYELIGQLAREKIIDLDMVVNALQYLVIVDWQTFSPLCKHLLERYGLAVNPRQNFQWLADESKKRMDAREAKAKSGK
jgi:hypothetical protein